MNKRIVDLTKKLGEIYVKISKLNAEKHVIKEQIWAERAKEFHNKRKVNKNESTARLLHKAGTKKGRRKH